MASTLSTRSRRALPRLTRNLATEAASSAESSRRKPVLRTAIILNRTPILTRTPTPFENAFYKYQQRIARTLHNPFPYDFYFKPGSILESRFILEERQRERSLFFPGFGADSKWAPQPKVSEEDLKKFGSEEDKNVRGRWGEADERADVRSLDRAGERNLYLVVRKGVEGKEKWRFPEGAVEGEEFLHEVCVLWACVDISFLTVYATERRAQPPRRMWREHGHLGRQPKPNRPSLATPRRRRSTQSQYNPTLLSEYTS